MYETAVLFIQPKSTRVRAGGLDRHRRGIDADDVEPETRELLGQKTAPAADVQGAQASSPAVALAGQDLTEVGEAARGHAAVQDVERAAFIPPGLADAIIDLIVDRHGDTSASCLSPSRATAVVSGRGPQRSLHLELLVFLRAAAVRRIS